MRRDDVPVTIGNKPIDKTQAWVTTTAYCVRVSWQRLGCSTLSRTG